MQKKRFWGILLWILALGWVAVLFVLSGQSGADSSDLSMRFTRFVLRMLPFLDISAAALEPILRKLAHAGIFAVEGFLLGLAAMRSFGRGRGSLLAAPACGLMAVFNELHQLGSPNRSCEIRDMGIDFAGAMAGICAAWLILLFIDKLSRLRVTNTK